MKKIITILLTAAMLLSTAACSKTADKGGNGEIVTLSWLVPGEKQADIASVMAEVNKITEEKIGAHIDLQFIDTAAFSERMKMNMAGGTAFDLCFTGWVNSYNTAVKNGGLADITDMIEKKPGLKKSIPDYVWEAATMDGRIYAVPNQQIFATARSLQIDKKIADKYDFDFSTVKTMDDLEPFLEMVKKGEPDKYPYRSNYGVSMWTWPVYEDLSGGYAIRKDGSTQEIVRKVDTEEYNHGVETLRRWYEKGYIRKDAISAGDDTSDHNAEKYVVWCASTKPGSAEMMKAEGREVIVVDIVPNYMNKSSALSTMTGIGVNSKNKEKALDFIELINTDKELYNLVCFGIKDKHYTLNEEGKVVYIPNSGYAPQADWKFGNQFNAYLVEGSADDLWEETKRVNDTAVKSPLLAFTFDSDPVKVETANFSAIGKKYDAANYGADDPKNYTDQMLKDYESAGQETIGKELQKQINEFFAKQK